MRLCWMSPWVKCECCWDVVKLLVDITRQPALASELKAPMKRLKPMHTIYEKSLWPSTQQNIRGGGDRMHWIRVGGWLIFGGEINDGKIQRLEAELHITSLTFWKVRIDSKALSFLACIIFYIFLKWWKLWRFCDENCEETLLTLYLVAKTLWILSRQISLIPPPHPSWIGMTRVTVGDWGRFWAL